MSIRLTFKISTYLVVLDGITALVVGGLLSPAQTALVLVAIAGSWWGEQIRARSGPALWRILALGAALFFLVDVLYLAESLLDGFVHLLLFLTCYKLYNRQTLRDFRDLFLLSFFMLVATSALTVSVAFLGVLAIFLLLGIWTFLLYHILTELERYAPEQTVAPSVQRFVVPSLLGMSVVASWLTLAFAFAFFFVIPRIGEAMLPLKARAGQILSGFSDRVELGAFGSIQTDPAVVMRVHFPAGPPAPEILAGLRWRGIAFDYFTGQEWRVNRPERKLLPRSLDGQFFVANPRGGRVLVQEVYLEPIGSDTIFASPRLLRFTIPVAQATVDSMESVTLPIRNARVRYVAYSELETIPPRGERADSREIAEEIRKRYLQLPRRLSPDVAALAREVTRGSRGPYEAALALTEHLRRSYRYSLDLRRETKLPPLEEFLFVTRAGNCEYFAASLAVLLRSLGIPARVINGFQRGEWNPYGQYLVVRQLNAHSWVEAYVPAVGWLTLDPSPRGELDAAFLMTQLAHYLDAVRMRWYRYVVNWSLTDQVVVASTLRHQALIWRRAVSKSVLSTEWETWGRWLVGAGAAGALVFLAARLSRRSRQTTSRRPPRPPRRLQAYEELLKRLARLALTPGPTETAREFAARAGVAHPAVEVPLREVTDVYERVRFGGQRIHPEEERRLLAVVRSVGA